MRIFKNTDEWAAAGKPRDEGDYGFGRFGNLYVVRGGGWEDLGKFSLDLSPLEKFMGPKRREVKTLWLTRRGLLVFGNCAPEVGSVSVCNFLLHDQVRAWVLECSARDWVVRVITGSGDYSFEGKWIPLPPITSPDLVPEPEKSPIDREIEKMMERRKAKRENPQSDVAEALKADAEWYKQKRDGEALEKALSKAFVHHTSFADRLAGYRGPGL